MNSQVQPLNALIVNDGEAPQEAIDLGNGIFMSRDVSNRVFKPSGCNTAFHTASHHLDRDDRITEFQKINTYHVSLLPHLLDKLKGARRKDPA